MLQEQIVNLRHLPLPSPRTPPPIFLPFSMLPTGIALTPSTAPQSFLQECQSCTDSSENIGDMTVLI